MPVDFTNPGRVAGRVAICSSSGQRRVGRMDCRAEKYAVGGILFCLDPRVCRVNQTPEHEVLRELAGSVRPRRSEQGIGRDDADRFMRLHFLDERKNQTQRSSPLAAILVRRSARFRSDNSLSITRR